MNKQYNKLFKPLSWWEKLLKSRVDKNLYHEHYNYEKYYIPSGFNIATLLEMYYYPKGYKNIFEATFKSFANNLVINLGFAILNHKISIEEVYNMFISSKSVQEEILLRIEINNRDFLHSINKYQEQLENGRD